MEPPETVEFAGRVFKRYPNSQRRHLRVYYWHRTAGKTESYHRVLWASVHGPIPQGHQIHHIDENPFNNSVDNLSCVTIREHRRSHRNCTARMQAHLDKVRPLASAWHKDPANVAAKQDSARRAAITRKATAVEKAFFCRECGKEFYSTDSKSKFCSNACCAADRRRSGIDDVSRPCAVCGVTFTINRYAKRRFCDTHRHQAMWATRRLQSQG